MYNYIIHPIAQQEYETSIEWYAERSEQATKKFILNIEKAIEAICLHPHQFRNEYKIFYELGVKKYPFSIIYIIDDNDKIVIITSIFHHKRNPKKKYKK